MLEAHLPDNLGSQHWLYALIPKVGLSVELLDVRAVLAGPVLEEVVDDVLPLAIL